MFAPRASSWKNQVTHGSCPKKAPCRKFTLPAQNPKVSHKVCFEPKAVLWFNWFQCTFNTYLWYGFTSDYVQDIAIRNGPPEHSCLLYIFLVLQYQELHTLMTSCLNKVAHLERCECPSPLCINSLHVTSQTPPSGAQAGFRSVHWKRFAD